MGIVAESHDRRPQSFRWRPIGRPKALTPGFKWRAKASESPTKMAVDPNDSSDRRAAQRFEIVAQASVASGGSVHVLAVRNISASGAFLEARPREHADLV